MEVDHAVAETAFVQQLEFKRTSSGRDGLPPPTTIGREEQVALVDQPGLERLGGEVGTAHADVAFRRRLHLPDRFGVEVALDPRPGAGYRLQRLGVHDLVGRLPDLRVVLHERRLVGEGPAVSQ